MASLNLSREMYFRYAGLFICIPFLIAPFFLTLPYRVNIFLSWEGAYRLSLGQIPYKDFGLPVGIGFWIIPALFFKLFGPSFLTLIKAQFFINLLSILSFRGILCNLRLRPGVISLGLLVFCLTYVIYNFWPWYNHSVIVYELIALYFLTLALTADQQMKKYISLLVSAFFAVLCFFTKQDVGGMCFFISLILLAYETFSFFDKKIFTVYILLVIVIGLLAVVPFIKYDFLYWFNYGQAPHNPRVNVIDLFNTFLEKSNIEKLYLTAMVVVIFLLTSWKKLFQHKNLFMLSVICFGMIIQSIVTRVSSPLPTDHMSYYHVFGFIFLITLLPWTKWSDELKPVLVLTFCLLILYSGGYWKYLSNVLNLKTQRKNISEPRERWTLSKLETLKGITLPVSTLKGIDKLVKLPVWKKKDLKVLNMSELTFLARELNYVPLTGHPLWYHVNIGMFQREIDDINLKIRDKYYDIVLFEDIPSLTEFYPYQVREQLRIYYKLELQFLAPRNLEDSTIEVFLLDNQ